MLGDAEGGEQARAGKDAAIKMTASTMAET